MVMGGRKKNIIDNCWDEDELLKKEIEEHLKKDGLISHRKPLRDCGERAVRYKLSSVKNRQHKLHDVLPLRH